MAKQHAKAADYGRVNGWLSSKQHAKTLTRGERQALNRMVYDADNLGGRGTMVSYQNGERKNVYLLADGRVLEAKPLENGTGDWRVEKCTS